VLFAAGSLTKTEPAFFCFITRSSLVILLFCQGDSKQVSCFGVIGAYLYSLAILVHCLFEFALAFEENTQIAEHFHIVRPGVEYNVKLPYGFIDIALFC
jgi:hypothetical protein